MKILQLCTKVPFPPRDGGAAGVYTFSEALQTLGHSIFILAVNPPKHYITKTGYAGVPERIYIHAVSVNTAPKIIKGLHNLFFSSMPYQVERFIDNDYQKKLIELLTTIRPDIIQLEGIYLSPYIPIIRKYSVAKIVLRSHNIEHLLWSDIVTQEKNVLKKIYFQIQTKRIKKYELKSIENVDGVTALTEHDLFYWMKHRPTLKSKLIPYGIPAKQVHATHITSTKAISYIGSLDWIPNQEAIIWFVREVWPLVLEKFPDCIFHIAGRNAPQTLSKILQTTNGIKFYGEIDKVELFYTYSNICIAPLFAGSGMRVKIVEAMHLGKIVIASSKAIEGIPAIAGTHYLPANNKDEFFNILDMLFTEKIPMDILSKNAQLFINANFDMEAITNSLIDFYKDLNNV